MHFVFIPYGKRDCVELLLREMEAQKFPIEFRKGKEKKQVWVQGSIRLLPFGVYEYIFPEKFYNEVVSTLFPFDVLLDRYLTKARQAVLRKMLRCKKLPKLERKNKFLWIKDDVYLIPVGIREDSEITEEDGWTHEAL